MVDWGQGAQGAAGGAMAGGAIGGPWGAAVGGALGGLGGLFGGGGPDVSPYQEQLKQLAAGYGSRTAPQGTAQTAAQSGFRQNQAGLIAQLEAMSRGQGPSAAAGQMKNAMDRAAAGQTSLAAGAGGRGVNAGAALRNATNTTAALQAQNSQDTGQMRVQEQLGAIGQLGQNVAAGRQADEGLNQFNAGAQNQMTTANMQAVLQQLGLNDSSQLQALLGAMGGEKGKPAGMGTSILAGGASAAPGLLQMRNQGQAPQAGTNPYASNPYGQSGPGLPGTYQNQVNSWGG